MQGQLTSLSSSQLSPTASDTPALLSYQPQLPLPPCGAPDSAPPGGHPRPTPPARAAPSSEPQSLGCKLASASHAAHSGVRHGAAQPRGQGHGSGGPPQPAPDPARPSRARALPGMCVVHQQRQRDGAGGAELPLAPPAGLRHPHPRAGRAGRRPGRARAHPGARAGRVRGGGVVGGGGTGGRGAVHAAGMAGRAHPWARVPNLPPPPPPRSRRCSRGKRRWRSSCRRRCGGWPSSPMPPRPPAAARRRRAAGPACGATRAPEGLSRARHSPLPLVYHATWPSPPKFWASLPPLPFPRPRQFSLAQCCRCPPLVHCYPVLPIFAHLCVPALS